MALAKCPKHGFSAVITISKNLKEIALKKENLNRLVMLVYEYENEPGNIDCRLYYFFSPDEAKKLSIPNPGLILRFNINAEIEPKDPYELVIREMTAMCSKCFYDNYGSLVKDAMKEYDNIKVKYLGYS